MGSQSLKVVVGPKGRVVVPSSLRRRLGIEPGEVLLARAEGDRLVLERRGAVLARLRSRYAVVPGDVSFVDDLLAERRKEAQRERRG
jgi:AbrB family looped-hinge helix DNA binding protein